MICLGKGFKNEKNFSKKINTEYNVDFIDGASKCLYRYFGW